MIGPFQWVLRNARVNAHDPGQRSAAGFVRGMPDKPHRSQVKRWEDGTVALTHGLVRRYETTLGLPEGQLLRAIDLIAREETPHMSGPAIPAPPSPDLVAEAMPLLEQALTYERMTGVDWDRLTTLLGSTPHVLVRRQDWETLVHRLSLETAVSTGLEYGHRWEASARVVSNPHVTDVVLEMIESALGDDDEQLYSDYATLLRFCPDPAGHDVLLDIVRRPPNARALWAALSTATTLVRHGLVEREKVDGILPAVIGIVTDDSLPVRTRKAAASLAERADGRRLRSGRSRGDVTVRLTARQRAEVAQLLETTGLTAAEQDRILATTTTALARETRGSTPDPELTTLVRTALREPHLDVRDTALAVLLLSPQGRTLGHVLAGDLDDALDADEPLRSVSDLSMLSWLTDPADLGLLLDVATGVRGTPEMASLAGAAVGNVDEPAGSARSDHDERLAAYARQQIAARLERPGAPAGNAWGVSYALGMRGRFDLVGELVRSTTPRRDPEWHTSLTWWTDLPESVRPLPPTPSARSASWGRR